MVQVVTDDAGLYPYPSLFFIDLKNMCEIPGNIDHNAIANYLSGQ